MKRFSLIVVIVLILTISGLSMSTFNSEASLTDSNMSQDTESNTLTGASVAMITKRISLGEEPQTIILKNIDKVIFNVDEESHTAQIRRIYSDYLIMNVRSFEGIDVNLYLDKTEKVDVNADEVYDLAMTLHEIISINLVNITFEKIAESVIAIPEEVILEEPIPKEIIEEEIVPEEVLIAEPIIQEPPEPKSKAWVGIIGIIVAAIIIYVGFCPRRKICQKKKVQQKKKLRQKKEVLQKKKQ